MQRTNKANERGVFGNSKNSPRKEPPRENEMSVATCGFIVSVNNIIVLYWRKQKAVRKLAAFLIAFVYNS